MQIDWALVERLAPSLAWPVVALLMFIIALPIVYLRLGELVRAFLELRDLPKTLREVTSDHQRLTATIDEEAKKVNSLMESSVGRIQTVVAELTTLRNELQSYQTEVQADALASESKSIESQIGAPDFSTLEAGKNSNEMYEAALGKWVVFTQTLENRMKEAGIEYDMRRIGRAAYSLTDRRRRNPLTTEEADLITNLARQARRFARLSETKDEWLTPEVYLRFVTGVEVATRAITRTKSLVG